ncbi:MAG: Rieske 2Fe-2S domain-containing protein [Bacteroidota bacterium]
MNGPLQEYRIARVQDLREKKGFLARVRGEEISVFKIEGDCFAIGNVCPHQHFSKLHEGEVKGFTVTCPMHGWTYDLRTGISTNADGKVKTYEVEVRNNEIFIRKQDSDAF